jgi:peptidyl-prolyl cis-trans isomerase B (cyclophilin B)
VASTKDRQRALERARYERVQEKIQRKRREQQRRRRLIGISATAAVAVAVVAVVIGLVAIPSHKSTTSAAADASATASATSSAAANPLKYEASGTSAVAGIGLPTFNATAAAEPYTATIQTNKGDIVFTALTKDAPWTTYSFEYLVGKNYFNNTKCHRLTTSGIFVLQCGDPTGTGEGGPGYTIPDENLNYFGAAGSSGTVTYKAGTVAMANTGTAHTGGSQFFLVYKDSPLAPSYTPFGTITQGLNILQSIAAQGAVATVTPSASAGASAKPSVQATDDGAPKDPVIIESVKITKG